MQNTPGHLNALRAFEASARHLSFSSAAAELHVTPAAVGQLVRSLEDWLGTRLFHRQSSGRTRLVLTEAAERALPEIQAGFDRLAMGLERLQAHSNSGMLTVTVSPAFAAKWLLPRLERFQRLCPDTEVRLDTSLKPVDFLTHRIDLGVRYGQGPWPGLQADVLMHEEVYPVASPDFLQRHRGIQRPVDLLACPLIHDLSLPAEVGFPTWGAWLRAAGVKQQASARGVRINNAAAVLQAAMAGQGVALARSVMAQDDLACGRLVRLFPQVHFSSPLAYHVVYRPECAGLPRLAAFRQWLMDEVAQA